MRSYETGMKNKDKKKGSLAASPFLTKPNPIFLNNKMLSFFYFNSVQIYLYFFTKQIKK